MHIKTLTPRQSLNKAFLKEKISRNEFDLLKSNLAQLFDKIDVEESEENSKTILRDFLNNIHYQDRHHINTLRDVDLVIFHENNQNKPAVLLEVKRPKNKTEMITKDNLNAKAMYELIRYFLEERIDYKNNELKFLIATNINEWFIFDASIFESLFFKNKAFVKEYENWRDKQKVSGNTDLFYNEIAKPFLSSLKEDITFTYFNLEDHKKLIKKEDPESKKHLISLYKILSPANLLKKPFANDSNSLDRNFYTELLHIIGLIETKDKNKKLISRKPEEERNPGSILENAIVIIETDNILPRLKNVEKYGADKNERLFNLALELSITWINRILFLKLLEAQLFKYHGDEKYRFLNKTAVKDFDELYKLFHQVLAIPVSERTETINNKFGLVPYLNSSLFEISDLESETIKVNSLDDNTPIELSKNTILKDGNKRRNGSLPVLHYLYEFLDAYDFTSEGKEEIQEDKKTLINASVLGLIFEKINGYKDGSFFTPGFITMYMCRETLTRSVVNKFNEKYTWSCESLTDLKNHLSQKRNAKDILEFNSVINSIKICDPAVGSGHFLVSALNELIAIKSELGLLADSKGEVLSGYYANVENDELIISYNNGEDIFEYHPSNKSLSLLRPVPVFSGRGFESEVQRVQETLFNEKQTIIENCLFGVDINPNSVKIARLRLWIELLKNAFYTKESGFTELETLPNIDINIKEGNSLISRFPLDADLKPALKTIRYTLEDYKNFVRDYKNTNDKVQKANFKKFIDDIKSNFHTEIGKTDPRQRKLNDLAYDLHQKFKTERLFGNDDLTAKQKEKLKKDESDLEKKIEKLRNELDDERNNIIYNNSFEWRFEFPEVLDDDANFVGFDVVIGNPPYIGFQELTKKEYYNPNFSTAKGKYDIYVLFIEIMHRIVNPISSNGFILPHKYLVADFGSNTRAFLSRSKFVRKIIHFGEEMVFEDATTYTCLSFFSHNNRHLSFIKCKPTEINVVDTKVFQKINYDKLNKAGWILADDSKNKIIEKVKNAGENITTIFEGVFQGIVSGDNDAYYIYDCEEIGDESIIGYSKILNKRIELEKELCKPLLSGKNLYKWIIRFDNTFIIYPYHLEKGKTLLRCEDDLKSEFPKTYEYFNSVKTRLNSRGTEKMKYPSWLALWNPRNINNFLTKKILTPDICLGTKMSYDSTGNFYHNDTSYALVKKESIDIPYEYFLGILNSKLIWFFLTQTGNVVRGGYFRFKTKYLEPLSLPISSKVISQNIVGIVDQIIVTKSNNSQADTCTLETEIDKLVYQLYGLTEDEIKIVEGNV